MKKSPEAVLFVLFHFKDKYAVISSLQMNTSALTAS